MESLATQTLIIFAIRTRRVPFFRSRPGGVLTLTTLAVIAVGIVLTVSPLADALGFTTLPWQFFTALVLLTIGYLVLVEFTKKVFYADPCIWGDLRTAPAAASTASIAVLPGSATADRSASRPAGCVCDSDPEFRYSKDLLPLAEARSVRKACGGGEDAELASNVASGWLVHKLSDSEGGESRENLRYSFSRAGQCHGTGERDQVGDMRLIPWVGLRQMPLTLGESFGSPHAKAARPVGHRPRPRRRVPTRCGRAPPPLAPRCR